jgi:hypothetical protein
VQKIIQKATQRKYETIVHSKHRSVDRSIARIEDLENKGCDKAKRVDIAGDVDFKTSLGKTGYKRMAAISAVVACLPVHARIEKLKRRNIEEQPPSGSQFSMQRI